MKESGLEEYCIDIDELNDSVLEEKFEYLVDTYDDYLDKLKILKPEFKNKSHITTDELFKTLNNPR